MWPKVELLLGIPHPGQYLLLPPVLAAPNLRRFPFYHFISSLEESTVLTVSQENIEFCLHPPELASLIQKR